MRQSASALVLSVLCSLSAGGAQEATELFIPIGRSPDLSDAVTVIGTIEKIDAGKRTMVVRRDGETATAEITDETRIFLDKSKLQESNEYGSFEDLQEGRRVEVLYQGRQRATEGPAEWVKVEVTR